MKKIISTLLIAFSVFTSNAQEIQAFFDYKIFHIPEEGPVLETYLNVFGNSLIYKPVENGEQGSVQVLILLKQGDEIVDFAKKTLLSPISPDSLYDDFIDIHRFTLKPGIYELELELFDLAFPDNVERVVEQIDIPEPPINVFISDLQWVAAYKNSTEQGMFTKSGYDLIPYVSNYFPQNMSKMMFYTEIYNTEKLLGSDVSFLFSAHIEKKESKKIIESAVWRTKKASGKVVPILSQFDIDQLETGKYTLVMEVRDRKNNLLATSANVFQKVGKEAIETEYDYAENALENTFVSELNSIDTLSEFIQSLRPIAAERERSLIERFERHKDLDMMKRFFYSFWKERDNNQPDLAWQKYKAMVADVNATYSTAVKKGYDTDMGRVYLAYGPPNTITDRPSEPSALPYQIWQYYRADRWTNVKFIFFDRTLLRQDYELLHCDNIPGEIKNMRWDAIIHQRDTPLRNVDDNNGRQHFGGRTLDFWDTPR